MNYNKVDFLMVVKYNALINKGIGIWLKDTQMK